MTAERTHLSIGETLTLLQPEFPDITISKIRFLESQGLLDPERTPSGYRKFHDEDIERLRWILTQQRDHFLPLKVIKDRLASGDLGGGEDEGVLPLGGDGDASGEPDEASARQAASAVPRPEENGGARSAEAPADRDDDRTAGVAGSEPVPEVTAEGTDPEEAPADVAQEPVEEPAAEAVPEPAERGRAVAALVEGPGGSRSGSGGRRRHPTRHTPGEPDPEPVAADDAEATLPETAATMSIDELAAASGVNARELLELERYGLIVNRSIGGESYYDEEALVVARLAAGFRRYGIEPRHLRMYKVAAEREAGLFEQLITPLLKQRRPAARQQAVEMLEDLAELADDLRAAMVRTALREYLGGS